LAAIRRVLATTTQPRTAPPGIECRPFSVRAGMRYTFSAWIKAAEPNTRVTLRFFEWADEGGDQPFQRHAGGIRRTAEGRLSRDQTCRPGGGGQRRLFFVPCRGVDPARTGAGRLGFHGRAFLPRDCRLNITS